MLSNKDNALGGSHREAQGHNYNSNKLSKNRKHIASLRPPLGVIGLIHPKLKHKDLNYLYLTPDGLNACAE